MTFSRTLILVSLTVAPLHAQEEEAPVEQDAPVEQVVSEVKAGEVVVIQNGQAVPAGTPVPPGVQPVQPGQPAPGQPVPGAQPMPAGAAKGAKPAGAKADAKSEAGPKPIKRPEKPGVTPDPTELDVRPEAGQVQFSFNGQPWPAVVEWLADVSGMSLDWQELPGDFLNLTTRRPYELPEARDLINRHLLVRGYTMLIEDETLRVVRIDKLNPAMVPRVVPEELADRLPNEFVRVSFKLESLVAESAVEELKPMMGPHGKLYKLATTNRLEAMDTVANLRAVYRLLIEEQSEQSQAGLVQNFQLEHRRASDVLPLLKELMGIEDKPKGPASPQAAQQMRAMQQALMQAQQQGKKVPQKQTPEIRLVLNQRENSILASGPPDKIAEIAQAIREIDVAGPSGSALLLNPSRMKVYRLESFDPQPLVDLLNELGDLDPQTQLKVDESNRAIIAYATLADHLTIGSLIERLDSASRSFHVVQLRRLQADYVAGTIRFMMGADEDKKSSNFFDYGYGFSSYGRRRQTARPDDKFKVDADVENNRLLLRANDIELAEITNLLEKLGEIGPGGPRGDMIRVFDVSPDESPAEILRRLEQLWPLENPLQIDAPPRTAPSDAGDGAVGTTKLLPHSDLPSVESVSEPSRSRQKRTVELLPTALRPQQDRGRGFGSTTEVARETDDRPPVRISVRADGQMIVTSEDIQALDSIERILGKLLPKRRDYRVFTLKYASPGYVTLTLEEFFETTEKKGSGYEYDPFFGIMPSRGDDGDVRLSRRRIPRFIWDNYTSTILVQGADPSQLDTIAQLIELYDQPEPNDSRSVRRTKMFQIKHSQATVIAAAIKEVFRDLLSSNDKALQEGDKDQKQPVAQRFFTYLDSDDEEDSQVKFKGMLSIGVDEISNTLIVSATSGLLDSVTEIVDYLDQAAQPASNVRVIPLSRNINIAVLQERLSRLLARPQKVDPRQQKPGQQGQPPQQPNGQIQQVVQPR